MSIDEAVKKAVDDCIKENILRDFLLKNKAEMIQMSIFEYDEEKHKKFLRQEGFEDGLTQGLERGLEQGMERGLEQGMAQGMERGLNSWKESILELLEELGNTPEHIKAKILSETNPDTLKEWNKLAARADSVDDFVKMSGIVCNNKNLT